MSGLSHIHHIYVDSMMNKGWYWCTSLTVTKTFVTVSDVHNVPRQSDCHTGLTGCLACY